MTPAHRGRAWLFLMASLACLLPNVAIGQGIEQPRVPLRTALDEIRVLREGYAEAFSNKGTAALVDMYASDAIVIGADGTMLTGTEAIKKSLEAGPWSKMSIESDSVRVFGNTAYDVGTVRTSSPDGDQNSHYLVVLRRGPKAWKISSLAVVPVRGPTNPGDSAGH